MVQMITQMGLDILTALIVVAILGAASWTYFFYKTLKKLSSDIKLMKKATAFVLRRQVHETQTLHQDEKDEIEDLERTFKEIIESE